jgi:tetratricopeptide (TPR) repeat protein
MRWTVPILALLTLPLFLDAQTNPSDIRLRLAQSYEKSGDFESALRVYNELFASDSGNFSLIESLKRCHLRLKQHDEVIALINYGLTLNPHDVGALAQLGNVWYMKGNEEKAFEAWQRAVAVEPNDETTYRVVGSSMVAVRQFERAVETYRAARKSLGKPTLFASDIAYLYALMQKFREATGEYLLLLRQAPTQLNYIQSRIAAFTGNEGGLKDASSVVEEAVKSDPKNIEFRRLLAWLSMEARDYDRAFDTYRQIDELTSAGGRELFTFAERALNDRSCAAASRAYAELINRNPEFPAMPLARFGLARSLEELAGTVPSSGDTSAAARYARASELYGKIVFDYPGTEIAARALYRLALIRKERFSDPEGAKNYLETIAARYKIFLPTAIDARMTLGEVYIELDDLDRAAGTFSAVAGPPPFGGADREKAAYSLAELRFYREDYKGALAILGDLVKNTSSDVANDAIRLQMLISEQLKENQAGLKTYGRALLLRAQRRYADAIDVLGEAIKSDTSNGLRDHFAFTEGEILSELGRPDDAIAAFSLIIDTLPESLLRDRAMFAVAGLYETARPDKAPAIGMYERLIEKYPNSIHANAARRRIRELRGDNI